MIQLLRLKANKLKGQHYEKNHLSIFNLNQILFENKPSRRFQLVNILSCSRDIHLLKKAKAK